MSDSFKKKIPEVMSPAGDFVCLDAALNAGANAVYFGVVGTNMRAGAKNFQVSELSEVAEKCHKFGAKAYLTLNTIYYNSELKNVESILTEAKTAGVDAVIAWDFGVLETAKKVGIEVFLSTQASVSNAASIVAYNRNFGIYRFVLARECTLDDIVDIRKSLVERLGAQEAAKISIEVFAHGAMCVSISGRCFLSQFECGKSANRGECRQPCRREYNISDTRDATTNFKIGTGYVLSPQDLCTLDFIEKLIDVGVDSLKIEGRNRNPEYVYTTTLAYVKARDFYLQNRVNPNFETEFKSLKKSLKEGLSDVFNRGFSNGFFMGKPIGDWTSDGNKATAKKVIVGHVTNYFSKISVAEVSIDSEPIQLGEEIQIEGTTTGFIKMKIESMQLTGNSIETAQKGMLVALKTSVKVRKGDLIFKIQKL